MLISGPKSPPLYEGLSRCLLNKRASGSTAIPAPTSRPRMTRKANFMNVDPSSPPLFSPKWSHT